MFVLFETVRKDRSAVMDATINVRGSDPEGRVQIMCDEEEGKYPQDCDTIRYM